MRGKRYTAYTIVTTLLEEIALAVVVLWLLPRFGITIPLWGLVFLIAALGAYNYITYRLCKETLDKETVTPLNAMIGCKGVAMTPLAPQGIVRIRGESWKARASFTIDKDEDIVIVGIEGLTILVASLSNNNPRADRANVDRSQSFL